MPTPLVMGWGPLQVPLSPPMDWGHPQGEFGALCVPWGSPQQAGGALGAPWPEWRRRIRGTAQTGSCTPGVENEVGGCWVQGGGGPWEGAQALFSFRKCLPSESVGRGAPAPAAGAACPRTSHGRAPRSGAGNLALLPKQPPGTSCCNRGDRLGVTCLALNA